MSSSVFDAPPHEPRFAYGTVRSKDGNLEQAEVVQATYLPEAASAKVQKTIVSMEFLAWMEKNCFSIRKPVGRLINASGGRLGRPNARASELVASTRRKHVVRGQFYWIENEPYVQRWWRFSLPWDLDKMTGVKKGKGGNREDYMRVAAATEIMRHQSFGPLFIETIWNVDDGQWYWFDFYAREEQDLMMIKMLLG